MKAAKQANQSVESARRESFIQRQCAHCAEEESTPFISPSRVGRLQTKLMVNEPGDIYEQEADRIADQVMSSPQHGGISRAPVQVQRLTENAAGQPAEAPPSVERALAIPGQPLEPELREEMENRFGGYDFSGVRIHTGQEAEQSARDVGANGYTVGRNIILGKNFFSPPNFLGQHLLAHELTHILQQNESGINLTDHTGVHVLQGQERRRSGRRPGELSRDERRFLDMRFSDVRTEVIRLRDYLHIARSSTRQGILALTRFLRFDSAQTIAINEHWIEIFSVPLIDSIRNVLGERWAQAAQDEINGAGIRVSHDRASRARAETVVRDRQVQADMLRISQNELNNPSFPLAQLLSNSFSESSPEQQAAIRHLLYFVVGERSHGNHRGLRPGVKYTFTEIFEGYYLGEYLGGYYWLRENLDVFRESGRDELIEAFRVGTLRAREVVWAGNIVQLFGMGVLGGAIVGGGLVATAGLAGGIALLDATGREIEARHYNPEDEIDWTEISFQTILAVVTAGFAQWIAPKIVGGLVSRFPRLASSTGQMLTEVGISFLQDQASILFQAVARAVFDGIRGRRCQWETFSESLGTNLAESLSGDQIFLSALGAFLGLSGPDFGLLVGGPPARITPPSGRSEASAGPPAADTTVGLDFQRLDAEFVHEILEGIEELGEPPELDTATPHPRSFEGNAHADVTRPEGELAASTVSQSQGRAVEHGGVRPVVDVPIGPGHLTVEEGTCHFCVNPCGPLADFLEGIVARTDLTRTTREHLGGLIRDARAHHEVGSLATQSLLEGFRNRLEQLASNDSQLYVFLRDRQQLLDLLTGEDIGSDIEAASAEDGDARRYSDDENPDINEEVLFDDSFRPGDDEIVEPWAELGEPNLSLRESHEVELPLPDLPSEVVSGRGRLLEPLHTQLFPRDGSIRSQIEFLARNASLLGPRNRQRFQRFLERVRDFQVRRGRFPPESSLRRMLDPRRTRGREVRDLARMLMRYGEQVNRTVRAQVTAELNDMLPFEVIGVSRRPSGAPYTVERIVAELAVAGASESTLTMTARNPSTRERIQIDNFDITNMVPKEVKSAEELSSLLEESGQRRLIDQLRRTAEFASDVDAISHYEWWVYERYMRELTDLLAKPEFNSVRNLVNDFIIFFDLDTHTALGQSREPQIATNASIPL